MAINSLVTWISPGGSRVPLPAEPSTYSAATMDIVDAGRNVEGVVIGNLIRSDIAKIEMTWRTLEAEDWALMCRWFNEKYGGSFYSQFEFYNEVANDWEVRTFYPGDRKAAIYSRSSFLRVQKDGRPAFYTDVELHLIEV